MNKDCCCMFSVHRVAQIKFSCYRHQPIKLKLSALLNYKLGHVGKCFCDLGEVTL